MYYACYGVDTAGIIHKYLIYSCLSVLLMAPQPEYPTFCPPLKNQGKIILLFVQVTVISKVNNRILP